MNHVTEIVMKGNSVKRAAIVELTPRDLAKALGLPDGMLTSIFAGGHYVDKIGVRLCGEVGDDRLPLVNEGARIPTLTIKELTRSREASAWTKRRELAEATA